MFITVHSLGDDGNKDAHGNDHYDHKDADKIHCFKKSSWHQSFYLQTDGEQGVLLNPWGDQTP